MSKCTNCDENPATINCESCDTHELCETCDGELHASKKMAAHVRVPLGAGGAHHIVEEETITTTTTTTVVTSPAAAAAALSQTLPPATSTATAPPAVQSPTAASAASRAPPTPTAVPVLSATTPIRSGASPVVSVTVRSELLDSASAVQREAAAAAVEARAKEIFDRELQRANDSGATAAGASLESTQNAFPVYSLNENAAGTAAFYSREAMTTTSTPVIGTLRPDGSTARFGAGTATATGSGATANFSGATIRASATQYGSPLPAGSNIRSAISPSGTGLLPSWDVSLPTNRYQVKIVYGLVEQIRLHLLKLAVPTTTTLAEESSLPLSAALASSTTATGSRFSTAREENMTRGERILRVHELLQTIDTLVLIQHPVTGRDTYPDWIASEIHLLLQTLSYVLNPPPAPPTPTKLGKSAAPEPVPARDNGLNPDEYAQFLADQVAANAKRTAELELAKKLRAEADRVKALGVGRSHSRKIEERTLGSPFGSPRKSGNGFQHIPGARYCLHLLHDEDGNHMAPPPPAPAEEEVVAPVKPAKRSGPPMDDAKMAELERQLMEFSTKLKAETDKVRDADAEEQKRRDAEKAERDRFLSQLEAANSANAKYQMSLREKEAAAAAEREAARLKALALEQKRDEERKQQLKALEAKLRGEQTDSFNKQFKSLNDHLATLQKQLAANKLEMERMAAERNSLNGVIKSLEEKDIRASQTHLMLMSHMNVLSKEAATLQTYKNMLAQAQKESEAERVAREHAARTASGTESVFGMSAAGKGGSAAASGLIQDAQFVQLEDENNALLDELESTKRKMQKLKNAQNQLNASGVQHESDQNRLRELQSALSAATLKIRSYETNSTGAILSAAAREQMTKQLQSVVDERDSLLRQIDAYERRHSEQQFALNDALSDSAKLEAVDWDAQNYLQLIRHSFAGDYLNLSRTKTVADAVQHFGKGKDQIIFSDYVKKYSRTGAEQPRILVLSLQDVYLFDTTYVLKRRIPIRDIHLLALSKLASHIMVLHHSSQPDLLLSVSKRNEVVYHLMRQYKAAASQPQALSSTQPLSSSSTGPMPMPWSPSAAAATAAAGGAAGANTSIASSAGSMAATATAAGGGLINAGSSAHPLELRVVYGERFYVRSEDHIRRDVKVIHTATKELEFGSVAVVDYNAGLNKSTGTGMSATSVLQHTGGNALTFRKI